jgi:hypothetical protein
MRPHPFTLFLALAALALCVCVAPSALAGKKECAAAYVEAQKLKKSGSLKQARTQLTICGADECMTAVKKDCIQWLDEVNSSLPTVVIAAKGPDGKETFDVKVTIDGEVAAEKLDVKAIELDPGTHKFVFEYEGKDPIEQEVIVREGQKNKTIEVSFASDAPAAPAPLPAGDDPLPDDGDAPKDTGGKKIPVISWVLGGVGVVALAGAGYFWLAGESEKSDLDSCKPNCPKSDVDSVKQKRLIGDIALGVGVVSIGAAVYFAVSQKPKRAPPADAARFDVQMRPGGAFAGVSGSF